MSGDTRNKLVRTANQIATFFRSFPEEEAVAGVHDYVADYWTPVMRRELLARIEQDATDVDPIVMTAMHRIGRGPSPTAHESAGPAELGEIGASDAG